MTESVGGKSVPSKDKSNTIKLKKSSTKIAGGETNGTSSKDGDGPASPSPIVNGKTGDGDEKPVCKSCRKPVDAAHYESHVSVCAENKKEAARRKKERKEAKAREAAAAAAKAKEAEDGDSVAGSTKPGGDDAETEKGSVNGDAMSSTKKPPKKAAVKASNTKSTDTDSKKMNKKRKADEVAAAAETSSITDKEPKKKKQKKDAAEEASSFKAQEKEKDSKPDAKDAKNSKPAKLPKPKGPVNVETQCGVPLEKEGKTGFCARSLTCKSHSMGLKRAVPGRSMPYDQLLAQYQRRNNAKQQKAIMEAHAAAAKAGSGGKGGLDEDGDASGPIDSEEERENVMKALGQWRPRPIDQYTTVPVGKRYRYVRLKEMLGNALSGSVAGGAAEKASMASSSNAALAAKSSLFAVPAVGPVVGTEGVMDTTDMASSSRRASAVSIAGDDGAAVSATAKTPTTASTPTTAGGIARKTSTAVAAS